MLGIASNVKGELIYTANNNFVITKLVNRDIYAFHVWPNLTRIIKNQP
jgi:hypothetical protein